MTTDPFTTADDRWDESPHHLADHCEHAGVGKACRRCRRKFDAASQWARDYLAEQEPTDTGDLVAVSWTDCDCEWETKYCDENHRRMTRIPRSALTRAARRDEEKR